MPVPDTTTKGTKPSPRTKPAPERRRDLLEAGLEVFKSKGVAAATLDQITRAANVAKGTFYLHFESKEHLLAALQDDFETRLVERAEAAAEAAGVDVEARLSAWVEAAFTHYPEDVALHDVLFHHPVLPERHPDRDGKAAHDQEPGARGQGRRDLVASLADLIRAGCDRGEFEVGTRPEDVELTAMLLCSALHRMFDRVWHRDEQVDPELLLAATMRLFRRAVGRAG